MAGQGMLVILTLMHVLKEGQGLQWQQGVEDGSQLTRCVGQEVIFPWKFDLEKGDDMVGITWFQHQTEAEDMKPMTFTLATFSFDEFKRTDLKEGRLSQVETASIQLVSLKRNDTARYSVSVRLSGQDLATQSVNLLVAEMPKTSGGGLEVKKKEQNVDTTQGQAEVKGEQLLCGQFTDLGSPPVSVVWEDPQGHFLPSSRFQDGFFVLDLPKDHKGGDYHCMLNLSSTAVGCLPDDSALRDKTMVAVLIPPAPSTAGLNGGAVAGITIAVLLIIVIIIVAVVFFLKFKRGKSYAPKEPESPGPDQEAVEPLKV